MSENPPKRRGSCGCIATLLVLVCLVAVVVIYLGFLHFRWFVSPIAIETFERGDTGWLVVGDAQGESDKPTHETEGGNPGAHMSAVDDAVGGVWFWSAPDSFLDAITGKWRERGSPGAILTFDLKQSDTSNPFEDRDVVLASGDLELTFRHESPPATEWTSYRVPLKPSAGWINAATNEPATTEEMIAVLSGLDRLWIRGEFRTGEDTGGIDNISIR